ncbi:hypothetical protein AFM18_13485 [Achromobacter spanius]|uniref:ESPR domain-containing protein n=2 Tax=Alcaligenaceae TaxID=506 RepID=A0AAW3I5A1_9BURK|nr:hypothetical protein AFM18_13485 [Achromobacter spanius]
MGRSTASGNPTDKHLSTRNTMRMSSELQDRLVQTVTATGLALVLALLALASPTPALAEGVDTLSACVAASASLR